MLNWRNWIASRPKGDARRSNSKTSARRMRRRPGAATRGGSRWLTQILSAISTIIVGVGGCDRLFLGRQQAAST